VLSGSAFSLVSEESLAHRVCLLLIELQLCMYQPDKTLALIDYIEKQFVVSTDSVISSEKEIKSLEKEHKEVKVHQTVSVCHKSKYVETYLHRKHADFNMLMFIFWL
jgi:hypothetical protein